MTPIAAWLTITLLSAVAAPAHGGKHAANEPPRGPRNLTELAWSWEFDVGVVVPLVISAALYAAGVMRLWRAAGVGRGVRRWQAAAFTGGWITLVVALVSPLHPWGNVLFSAHMVQHELLMLVAAPLLAISQPLVAMLKALPGSWSRAITAWSVSGVWQRVWATITHPLVAWLIHAVVLWAWHIPVLFDATLTNDFIHALQHLSFLLSALLFWWSILCSPAWRMSLGVAVLYMFTTALHSGFLGALITFATTSWYPAYQDTTAAWGLTPLEDQHLGGLIMWAPAYSIYIVFALATFVVWMQRSQRRVARWEQEIAVPVGASS
jgi:cytochrome c oxidase assembly factor CtaG